jgi:hypothetical protein
MLNTCGPDQLFHSLIYWDDIDFSGSSTYALPGAPLETRTVWKEYALEESGPPTTLSCPELPELRDDQGDFDAAGNAEVVFAEYGAFTGNKTFHFPIAGSLYDRLYVSKKGVVGFDGPVSAPAALDMLSSGHAIVAPAWSDSWDTSRVRVHVGYAPVQTSYVTGEPALAFVVEWRGLYSPNGMRTSLRLMLVDDGTYRVDYGAIEVGEMPLVVGYGSPDGGPVSPAAPAEHSWGAEPLGTGEEPAAGVAFGPGNPANVDHLWVRWRGYPESVASPDSPVILDPKLKKARKVTLRANGSRIASGASLVVDGIERFPLTRGASGTKWIVGKRARSAPSNLSVADIWSDGAVHTIRVENPDGRRSQSAGL